MGEEVRHKYDIIWQNGRNHNEWPPLRFLCEPLLCYEDRRFSALCDSNEIAQTDICGIVKVGAVDRLKLALTIPQVNVNMCNPDGQSPIHIAAYEGFSQCVQILVRHGADLNQGDNRQGYTALHIAAMRGHIKCITALMSVGCDVNITTKSTKRIALHYAAEAGSFDIVTTLLKLRKTSDIGKCINCQDEDGHTPLTLACIEGSMPCINLLLKHGADVTLKDRSGRTAIDMAREMRRNEVVIILELLTRRLANSQSTRIINNSSNSANSSIEAHNSSCYSQSILAETNNTASKTVNGKQPVEDYANENEVERWVALAHGQLLCDALGRVVVHKDKLQAASWGNRAGLLVSPHYSGAAHEVDTSENLSRSSSFFGYFRKKKSSNNLKSLKNDSSRNNASASSSLSSSHYKSSKSSKSSKSLKSSNGSTMDTNLCRPDSHAVKVARIHENNWTKFVEECPFVMCLDLSLSSARDDPNVVRFRANELQNSNFSRNDNPNSISSPSKIGTTIGRGDKTKYSNNLDNNSSIAVSKFTKEEVEAADLYYEIQQLKEEIYQLKKNEVRSNASNETLVSCRNDANIENGDFNKLEIQANIDDAISEGNGNNDQSTSTAVLDLESFAKFLEL